MGGELGHSCAIVTVFFTLSVAPADRVAVVHSTAAGLKLEAVPFLPPPLFPPLFFLPFSPPLFFLPLSFHPSLKVLVGWLPL